MGTEPVPRYLSTSSCWLLDKDVRPGNTSVTNLLLAEKTPIPHTLLVFGGAGLAAKEPISMENKAGSSFDSSSYQCPPCPKGKIGSDWTLPSRCLSK